MNLHKLNLHLPLGHAEDEPKDIEYKHTSAIRIMSIILIGLLATVIGVTVFFAYQSITRTIGQVNAIILLQSEINIEPIDAVRLTEIREAWERKQSTTTLTIERDPFTAVATSTNRR